MTNPSPAKISDTDEVYREKVWRALHSIVGPFKPGCRERSRVFKRRDGWRLSVTKIRSGLWTLTMFEWVCPEDVQPKTHKPQILFPFRYRYGMRNIIEEESERMEIRQEYHLLLLMSKPS